MPVRGEAIPPTKKLIKPNKAEALPELSRSRSRANVVDVGRIIPNENIKEKNIISNIKKGASSDKANATRIPMIIKVFVPDSKALSVLGNFVIIILPIITATAFSPKHKLYINGDNPYTS